MTALFSSWSPRFEGEPWLAQSPEAICLIDVEKVPLLSCADLTVIVLVEQKISICHSSVQGVTGKTSLDMTFVTIREDRCTELVSFDYEMQIICQAVECCVANALYVVSSEAQIIYAVFVTITQEVLLFEMPLFVVGHYLMPNFAWIQEGMNPPSHLSKDHNNTIMTVFELWASVNNPIMEKHPLLPINAQNKRGCG